jgi:Cof subfamily protein (haloacid dehalogenase superfamily)
MVLANHGLIMLPAPIQGRKGEVRQLVENSRFISSDLREALSKIELVAVDIDGTLLDSNHKPSEGIQEAIKASAARGIRTILVTGRNRAGLLYIMNQMSLKQPYICSGGGYIADPETNEVIAQFLMSRESAERVVEIAREENAAIFFEAHLTIFAEASPDIVKSIGPLDELDVVMTQDILQDYPDPPQKIVIVNDDPRVLSKIEEKILTKGIPVFLSYSAPRYMEITQAGASKGKALIELAKHLRIPLHRVAAIGDENNDLSMFKVAGVAIAMGNATAEVKHAADIIAPNNDEGGVAWALRQLINARDESI